MKSVIRHSSFVILLLLLLAAAAPAEVVVVSPAEVRIDGANAGSLAAVCANHPRRVAELQVAIEAWAKAQAAARDSTAAELAAAQGFIGRIGGAKDQSQIAAILKESATPAKKRARDEAKLAADAAAAKLAAAEAELAK